MEGAPEMEAPLKSIIAQTLDLAGKQVVDNSLDETQLQIEDQRYEVGVASGTTTDKLDIGHILDSTQRSCDPEHFVGLYNFKFIPCSKLFYL